MPNGRQDVGAICRPSERPMSAACRSALRVNLAAMIMCTAGRWTPLWQSERVRRVVVAGHVAALSK
jgi:hypothetical protein